MFLSDKDQPTGTINSYTSKKSHQPETNTDRHNKS